VHGCKVYTPQFNYEYIQNVVNDVIDKQFLTPYK